MNFFWRSSICSGWNCSLQGLRAVPAVPCPSPSPLSILHWPQFPPPHQHWVCKLLCKFGFHPASAFSHPLACPSDLDAQDPSPVPEDVEISVRTWRTKKRDSLKSHSSYFKVTFFENRNFFWITFFELPKSVRNLFVTFFWYVIPSHLWHQPSSFLSWCE